MAIKIILTDIEGTTSSISFVKDVLFPYASKHLADFVSNNHHRPQVRAQLDLVAHQEKIAITDTPHIIEKLLSWIKEDKKEPALKNLQGLIWKSGYENGDYKAHMYSDAVANLQHWHEHQIPIYIYSSGSIYAQKLFFAHTDYGDLLPLFSGHFDTTVGHKQDPQAYTNIHQAMAIEANEILFLSDIEAELDAAKRAGMQTCWVVRDLDIEKNKSSHVSVRSFDEITL